MEHIIQSMLNNTQFGYENPMAGGVILVVVIGLFFIFCGRAPGDD